MLARVEGDAAAQPFDAERDSAAARGQAGLGVVNRVTKRVTKSADGSNESRVGRIVADGIANLAHEVGEVLFDHERRRPQTLLEITLRDRLRPAGDENGQQLERFG